MERVIEFRAWHKEFGEMVYTKGNSIFEKREFSPFVFEVGFSHYPESEWEIMQCIGKMDVFGKKMYEGDFIKDAHGNVGIIEWNEDVAAFSWSGGQDWGMIEVAHSKLSVIGNIYENPELKVR